MRPAGTAETGTPRARCRHGATHSAAYTELPEPVTTTADTPSRLSSTRGRRVRMRAAVSIQVTGCWAISRTVWP